MYYGWNCIAPGHWRRFAPRFWMNTAYNEKYISINGQRHKWVKLGAPVQGKFGGTQPKCRWMNGSSCKTLRTFSPAWTHFPSFSQYPPLSICFSRSIDANLFAMSRLGAW